jgi:tryptophan aminotransferase
MPIAVASQSSVLTPVTVDTVKSTTLLPPVAIDAVKAATTSSSSNGLDHRAMLSRTALLRPDSAIRSLFPAEKVPGMLSLLAGKPNTDTFPISNIALTIKPIAEEKETILSISGSDLEEGLQYGQTWGLTRLLDWLTQFQSRLHGRSVTPSSEDNAWRVSIGGGSQDLLTKAFNSLINPGDSILVESPVYTGILPTLACLQANVVGVQTDSQGLMSSALEETLSNWTTSLQTAAHPFPKIIYTVPTAANPSGATASEQRKREVLAVARRFGVLIFEDDPYMLLSFDGLGEDTPETRRRVRTYWSLEQDEAEEWGSGWVVRFDSFSKIISGGIRVGFVTGPKLIVDYIDKETSSANLQGSGASQAIVLALLEHWKYEGLLQHCDRVAAFYRKRRDNFEAKARAVLGAQSDGRPAVAEWVTPEAGMFLWLRLNLPPVSAPHGQHGDSFSLVSEKAKAKGVLAVPGVAFMPNEECSSYVRTSYSIIPEEDVEEAFKRIRDCVEEAWQEQGPVMM